MTITYFRGNGQVGDWWPRPDQAATGALDHLPVDQWPILAAKWLAAGFDSPLLRELAELRAPDIRHHTQPADRNRLTAAMDALDLMPEAMPSIGFDPAPANEEFMARCQRVLDVVQHDLDVTGYSRYRMRAGSGGGWPSTVFATLPDGSRTNTGHALAPVGQLTAKIAKTL